MARISLLFESLTLLALLSTLFIAPDVIMLGLAHMLSILFVSLPLVWSLTKLTAREEYENDNIRYGKRLSVSSALAGFVTHYDKVLVGQFVGFIELATYNIALLLPEQIKTAITSFMVPYVPEFSKDGSQERVFSIFRTFLLFCAGVALLYFFLAPLFFTLFFPKYEDAVFITQMAGIGIILSLPFLLVDIYFKSQGADHVILRSTLLGLGTSLAGIFLLAPGYGIVGIVAAKVGSLYLQGAYLLYALHGFHRGNLSRR